MYVVVLIVEWIIASCAIVGLLVGLAFWIIKWCDIGKEPITERFFDKEKIYLSFETFKALYIVAPLKWELDASDCSAKYKGEWVYMKTLKDCWKFRRLVKTKAEEFKEEVKSNKMKRLLERWQADVEEFQKKGEA